MIHKMTGFPDEELTLFTFPMFSGFELPNQGIQVLSLIKKMFRRRDHFAPGLGDMKTVMASIYLVLIFGAVLLQQCCVFSASHTLPRNFIKCKKTDPNIDSCVQNAFEDAIQKMKNDGSPSLGILPLDPLVVEELHITSGSKDSPIHLNIHFKNLKIKGISQMNITTYRVNLKDAEIFAISNNPRIELESDYVADGKVLLLPVTGNGKCKFIFDDMKTTNHMIFKPQEKNGQIHWIIQDCIVKFEPKKMRVHFDNLLNGDKGLNDGINDVLNQNWEAFLQGIRPQFESALGQIFKELTNRVFSKVPIDNIFE